MGRRGDQLQRFWEGLTKGDPGAIAMLVGVIVISALVIYWRSRNKG